MKRPRIAIIHEGSSLGPHDPVSFVSSPLVPVVCWINAGSGSPLRAAAAKASRGRSSSPSALKQPVNLISTASLGAPSQTLDSWLLVLYGRRTMSAENIEIVRRMLEAYAQGGFAAVSEFTHPDFEMRFMAHHPLGGRTYRAGEAGQSMLEFAESFEDFDAEAEELVDAGDHVVVALRERGRARGSVELEQIFGILYTLREGKIFRMQWFDSPDEALAAANTED